MTVVLSSLMRIRSLLTLKANKPFTVGKRLVSIWLWAIWVIQDEQELIIIFMNHERGQ